MLWFLFIYRVNLSPFTKDYRGEEHLNELDSIFGTPSFGGVIIKYKDKIARKTHQVGGTFSRGVSQSGLSVRGSYRTEISLRTRGRQRQIEVERD